MEKKLKRWDDSEARITIQLYIVTGSIMFCYVLKRYSVQ